jgi:hypothetical protein
MTLLPTAVTSISDPVIVFVLPEPLPNQCLQRLQRVGPKRRMPAPLDRKFQGTIESRDLIHAQPLGLTLAEPHPRNRLPVLDLIIEGYGITADVKTARQCFQPLTSRGIEQLVRVKDNPGALEISPAPCRFQLRSDTIPKPIGGELQHGAPRSAPQLVQFHQSAAESVLIGMGRFVVD